MADTRRTDDDLAQDILKRLDQLKLIRQPFEARINEVIDYVNHGLLTMDPNPTKGQKTGLQVYDDTAIRANNLRAMGLHGYLFSPGWFKHELSNTIKYPRHSSMRKWTGKRLDEYPDVAKWLTESQEVMYAAFSASNWYTITTDVFRMAGAIGTVPIFAEKDTKQDRICFTPVHLRECYLSRNMFNDVDGVYRVYKVPLRDLIKKFGIETLKKIDPMIEAKYEQAPYDEWEITHATYEREDRDKNMVDAVNMQWASVWLYGKKILLESGFPYFPWIVHDEQLNTGDWYSRSPGYDAIVPILSANQYALTNLKAGHRAVDPPYAMMESLRGRANLNAAGRTYLRQNEEAPIVLDTGLRGFAIAEQFVDKVQQAIREYYHTDIFLMMNRIALENKNITATQVIEMTGEKAAVLSSDTERIERRVFNPTIDIVFAFEYDAGPDGMPRGRIPAPPDIIREMGITKLDTDFQGPLSQARKRFYKSQGIKAGISDVAMIAELDPSVLLVPKWHKLARYVVKESFPADCMNSEDEVKQIQIQQAQAMQAQQIDEGLLNMSKALPGMSKAPEEGSPMDALGKALAGGRG